MGAVVACDDMSALEMLVDRFALGIPNRFQVTHCSYPDD